MRHRSYFFRTLLLGLLIHLLSPDLSLAQTFTVRGTVVDDASGERLPLASIRLLRLDGDAQQSTLLGDADGIFTTSGVSPGQYRITISYIGYSPVIIEAQIAATTADMGEIRLTRRTIEFDATVVTASRYQEKAVDAPAHVSVMGSDEVIARPALSPSEHLKSMPGVDVVNTGLNQSRVAVRGFNNAISNFDKLLTLTDYRNTSVPSIRMNNMQLISTTNDDIDRIEVVSGPGSALYGPNAANGVMHIITRSPLESSGSRVTVGVGERSLMMASFRHAGRLRPNIGYKISGQHYQGTDWKTTDPAEPDSVIIGVQSLNGRVNIGGLTPNQRDYGIRNSKFDSRIDFRINPDLTAIFSGGLSRATSLNITDIGAIAHKNWIYGYAQGRMTYKKLFIQSYLNRSHLDDNGAYLLRSGDILIEKSSVLGTQIQHQSDVMKQRLTYGVDMTLTRPNTGFTINGRNEKADGINEFGYYLQSETQFLDPIKLVGTVRVDSHSRLKDPVISPRFGVVLNPHDEHNFRFTYNRAFTTPSAQILFLDLNVAPSLGPLPYPLQALGLLEDGFTFRRDSSGGVGNLYMQSPFTPPTSGGSSAFIPADATERWDAIVGILLAQGVDLSGIPAPASADVLTQLRKLNTATNAFDLVTPSTVTDIGSFKPSTTNTLEFGYRGSHDSRWSWSTDFYYSRVEHFVTSLDVQTPNVFFDSATLSTYLGQFLPAADAAALADNIAQIPVGTVTPDEAGALSPSALVLTFRNFVGDVSLYGTDFNIGFFATPNLRFTGNYSFTSKDLFRKNSKQPEDIALNAPKHKFGGSIRYFNPAKGMDTQLRFRYVNSFPVRSGVFIGAVPSYATLDLNTSWALPFSRMTRATLSVQNLLNNKHLEYIGTPKIGRLAILQLTQQF
jgi:outer membrane receptor for ferrienterochelin and colicins